jgi:hypothetical protein
MTMRQVMRRGLGVLAAASVLIVSLAPGSALAVLGPPNDDFANSIGIQEANLPFRGAPRDLNTASPELNEPTSSCGDTASQTIWYDITVEAKQLLQADTLRSDFPGGNIDVFRGSTLADLQFVACNDGRRRSGEPRSLVTWIAKPGVHYYIRVSHDATPSGSVRLAVRSVDAPGQDNFGTARLITMPFRVRELNTNATLQPNEVQPSCAYVGSTLWWRFKPASTMLIESDTFESDTDTVLAIYEGSSLKTLTEDFCDNDAISGATQTQSNVSFYARAGHLYYFQVGGYHGSTGKIGFRVHRPAAIANDKFANANEFIGPQALKSGNTNRATLQPGEPLPSCAGAETGATVWYKHTATDFEFLSVDPVGIDFNGAIAVWQGSSLGTLTELQCALTQSGSVFIHLDPGDTVYVSLGGVDQATSGPFSLQFSISSAR